MARRTHGGSSFHWRACLVAVALAAGAAAAAAQPLKLFTATTNSRAGGAAQLSADLPAGSTLMAPANTPPGAAKLMTTMAVQALKQGPEQIELNLPGFNSPVVTQRRQDILQDTKAMPAAMERETTGGFAAADVGDLKWDIGSVDPYQWVGDVKGFEGPRSVVALAVSEQDNSVHGIVRFVDKKNKVKLYHIEPTKVKSSSGKVSKHPGGLHNVYAAVEPKKASKFRVPPITPGSTTTTSSVPNTLTTSPLLGPSPDLMSMSSAAAPALSGQRHLLADAAPAMQDILIVYTPAAAKQAGGDAALVNQARLGVAMANKAYADSRINLQMNLLDIRKVNYTETTDPLGDLTDGLYGLSVVRTWRDQVGADLVSLFNNNNDVCGVAWMAAGQYPDWAYSAVMRDCWNTYTLAHEVGHNQGCGHNVVDGRDSWQAAPYAFGWRVCSTTGGPQFKSIMSYDCATGTTPRIGMFSSPNLTYTGIPFGSATDADCARAIRLTADRVANFRKAVPQSNINLNPNSNINGNSASSPSPPTAVNDVFTVFTDMPNDLDVLANDFDKDGNAFAITSISKDPTNGLAVVSSSGRRISYSPFGTGSDSLKYVITDTTGRSAEATVSITAIKNTPPVLKADSFTVFQDGNITFNLTNLLSNDVETDASDKMSLPVLQTAGMQGTLSLVQGTIFRYVARKGWTGKDTIQYYVTDAAGAMVSSTVTFDVVPDPCVNNMCAPLAGVGSCSSAAGACSCSGGLVPVTVPSGGAQLLACKFLQLTPSSGFVLDGINEAPRGARMVFSFRLGDSGSSSCPSVNGGKVVRQGGVAIALASCPASAPTARLAPAPRGANVNNPESCSSGLFSYVVSTPRSAGCYSMAITLVDRTVYRTFLRIQ